MLGIKRGAVRSSRVRPSVVRRAIVGSLVVMLAPFLTVLEHDADAAVLHRTPIIYDSAPVQQLDADAAIQPLPALQGPTDEFITSIRDDIRLAVYNTWNR